jgi:hypothetical protein
MSDTSGECWLRAALLAVSVAALGHALQIGDGILQPHVMRWLILSVFTCAAGTLAPMPRVDPRAAARVAMAVIGLVLAWQIWQLFERPPFNNVDAAVSGIRSFRVLLSITSAMALVLALLAPVRIARLVFPAVLVGFFALGVWVIRAAPVPSAPPIDVYVFQQEACAAVLKGTNPYTITFPDVIGAEWYGPGVSVNGRLRFGYPYMPLTLLMSLPGYLLAGDVRYSHLAAIVGAAALIAYARPSRLSFAAAALLLLQPRGLYILERSWCEPQVVLLLAATVFAAARGSRYVPLLVGLLIVSKQYMLATAALAPLLVPVWTRRKLLSFVGEAALVALVATLPLAMLAPAGFWRSAVALQFRQLYRWDSANFVAWLGHARNLPRDVLPVPWWLAFVLLLVAIAIALWSLPRTTAAFASAVALCYFVFFAFAKQAFANYYFLVIGAACCAIATIGSPAPVET